MMIRQLTTTITTILKKFHIPHSTFLIAIQPPQPPTVPAPAVRPTPPTPPHIDKTPFEKSSADKNSTDETSITPDDESQVTREVQTPESMAREAVANGSGALTKRTVERGDDEQSAPVNQTVTVIPPDAPIVIDTQSESDYNRGQDVLRQFRELDAQQTQSTENVQTSTEQPRPAVASKFNHNTGYGVVYWLFTIIFMGVAAFVVVKKFLLTDKPALTKSQLFEDSSDRLKAAVGKVKPVTDKVKPVTPPQKSATLPPKNDDRGKHFEVRV